MAFVCRLNPKCGIGLCRRNIIVGVIEFAGGRGLTHRQLYLSMTGHKGNKQQQVNPEIQVSFYLH